MNRQSAIKSADQKYAFHDNTFNSDIRLCRIYFRQYYIFAIYKNIYMYYQNKKSVSLRYFETCFMYNIVIVSGRRGHGSFSI